MFVMRGAVSFVCVVLVVALLSGCRPERPGYVLSEDKMEDILYDYHVAQAMAENEEGDVARHRYLMAQTVFEKHGVTQEVFDSSMVWWCAHSEKLKDVYARVTVRLQRQVSLLGAVQAKPESVYAHLDTEGDTANVWNRRPYALLVNNALDNFLRFEVVADSTYRVGDRFTVAFKPLYVSKGAPAEAYLLFGMEYENDSIEGVVRTVVDGTKGVFELEVAPSERFASVRVRRVFGCVYLPSDDERLMVLSLSDIVLVRYHSLVNVTDSVAGTAVADSLVVVGDSLGGDSAGHRRLTPAEIKAAGGEIHKFKIVKDKPLRRNVVRRRQ